MPRIENFNPLMQTVSFIKSSDLVKGFPWVSDEYAKGTEANYGSDEQAHTLVTLRSFFDVIYKCDAPDKKIEAFERHCNKISNNKYGWNLLIDVES